MVGKANHIFLANWIKGMTVILLHRFVDCVEFPEFRNNDFYIVGESYAGVYVPMLADAIMNDPISGINLVGVALGGKKLTFTLSRRLTL
jgi:carboxypeptidase C (cathepsin A)